jgi:hypothetical protein
LGSNPDGTEIHRPHATAQLNFLLLETGQKQSFKKKFIKAERVVTIH